MPGSGMRPSFVLFERCGATIEGTWWLAGLKPVMKSTLMAGGDRQFLSMDILSYLLTEEKRHNVLKFLQHMPKLRVTLTANGELLVPRSCTHVLGHTGFHVP